MRIGELARLGGTRVGTIRYYEQVGLLPAPPRTSAGYRRYRLEHVRRLQLLLGCRGLGFSIDEIRSLLCLVNGHNRSCTEVTRLTTLHLDEIRTRIANLARLEQALAALVDTCPGGPVDDCRILEVLARPGQKASPRIPAGNRESLL